ncbi:Z band alternatively spliced PDZ-motif protein 52 isoform X5 [Arctopsyche grandis]|uniref:Z band alternatively spliced PDZ-motif protein 52 isoform X5 n=1 Tax=Arctopsyche grandis TaxID=121162 RepID=UPI00406D9649
MAQLLNIRLNRPESCPLGFRLQGGKDFGTPLVIQKVNGGSPAEKAGLQAGDSVIKVNTTDVFNLRHKEAQDVIVRAGQNFDITVQRGGSTWKPSVTPVGALPTPAGGKSFNSMSPVTQTSLKANNQPAQNIGSGYNNAAKPFNYMNGNGDSVKSIVNKQYNTPVGIYSEETIAETLSAQAEVLAGGVLGVNFKKNEKIYDSEKSEVFKMLQEADNEPEPEATIQTPTGGTVTGLRHVMAPVTRPEAPANNTGGLPPGQNICEECERLIIGVFVRIKDKNLHVECFKCATCGSSLKNQGYYNLNGKLYCDIHAKMVARQNPPAPNLDPVTILPKLPSSTISSALSSHSVPLPPLSNPIPPAFSGNGPSPFSPSNNISGPKPFGAPISPVAPLSACSISPRSVPSVASAPISPASTLQRPIQQALVAQPLPGQYSTLKVAAPFKGGAGSGAGRGKTFGVSSAPKRGRGILNKAAGPGTRVPLCAHCNGHIRGPFISALGRIWCPEHFVCVNNTCRRHLQDIGFVEENGQLYCEYCFEQFIAPACDKCHAKIKGDCLNAIGKHFHPECFCCAYCGKLFGNNPFFLEEGLPYCEADWNELFTTKCFACGFPVEAGDRCAKKISKDRVSTPREDVHSAKTMLANSYTENIIASSPYTTDQIYQLSNETTDFTNMNISPNFQSDRGIFSDILSTTGKVLGTVTMDTIHSSTVCDITDTPITDDLTAIENDALYSDGGITPKSICDTMRTETYTNEDVLRIKLAPTLIEFDEYLLGRNTPNIDNTFMKCLTPSLVSQTITYESNSRRTTPEIFHRYGENNSSGIIYKSDVVVEESSSLPLFMMNNSKEYTIKTMLNNLSVTDNLKEVEENSIQKQINEIDIKSDHTKTEQVINHNTQTENRSETKPTTSKAKNQVSQSKISKLKSTILNMPIHYHAAIICFFLVLYNVLFNIYKQNVDKSNSLFA